MMFHLLLLLSLMMIGQILLHLSNHLLLLLLHILRSKQIQALLVRVHLPIVTFVHDVRCLVLHAKSIKGSHRFTLNDGVWLLEHLLSEDDLRVGIVGILVRCFGTVITLVVLDVEVLDEFLTGNGGIWLRALICIVLCSCFVG